LSTTVAVVDFVLFRIGQMSLITEFEPLSHDEERERLHLERKVERAFYEAGLALQTLRDRKLYRSTHKTFQEYCLDRFDFAKSHSYRGIPSAKVVKEIVNQIKGQEISVFAKNNPQIEFAEFVPIGIPKIGQQVKITSKHPLFPSELGIILELP
jgi:hypothetical protein